jgi:hypothetical protein
MDKALATGKDLRGGRIGVSHKTIIARTLLQILMVSHFNRFHTTLLAFGRGGKEWSNTMGDQWVTERMPRKLRPSVSG